MSRPEVQGDVNWGTGCRGLHGSGGVNNRSASLCQQLLSPLYPQQTHSTPPHIWKNPIQLIRFFKMDQFLISRASDYGQYHCRGEDSCWTAVFIYRNVCFLLYADGEIGTASSDHCTTAVPGLSRQCVWPLHALVDNNNSTSKATQHSLPCDHAIWKINREYLFTSEQKAGLV